MPLLGCRQDISSLLAQHKLHRAGTCEASEPDPSRGRLGDPGTPPRLCPGVQQCPHEHYVFCLAEPSRSATLEVQPTTQDGAERRPIGQPGCLCPYDRAFLRTGLVLVSWQELSKHLFSAPLV